VNAVMYTSIILLTAGSQAVLAEMYAIGLLASFCINVGCLLIYRWFQGTKDIRAYHTSRVGTLLLEAVLICCFVYLAFHKPYGRRFGLASSASSWRRASRSRVATDPK
jgi:hypothetical protein